MVHGGNRYLFGTTVGSEMWENMLYIWESLNWTDEAKAGLLGNLQTESTGNPQIWQNLSAGSMKLGYGIAQWTPAGDFLDWVRAAYNVEWDDLDVDPETWMDIELARFQYELENGLQYYKTKNYPLTFQQYIESEENPGYLAYAWLNNYERPADRNQPKRQKQALFWYQEFNGTPPKPPKPTPIGPDPKKIKGSIIPVISYVAQNQWRYR